MIFLVKFLQVFDKIVKKSGAGAVIRNYGYRSERQFNYGSSISGSATVLETLWVN